VDVYLNGVHLLDGTDYTASNSSDIVLTAGASAGDVVEVISFETFEVASQTFTGTTTVDALTATGAVTPASMNWSAAKRTRAALQSIPNATATIIAYNTLTHDNLSELDSSGRFTASIAGNYHFSASALFANAPWGAGERAYIALYKNGAEVYRGFYWSAHAAVTDFCHVNVSVDVTAVATDYFDIRVIHNRGASTDLIASAAYNHFSVHRIS